MKKNILFVCKYNKFRSRVAESFFNKLNKNPNYKAKSAGIIKDRPEDIIHLLENSICGKMGISLKGSPQGISFPLLKWQDIIVIVANDVPSSIFKDNKRYGKKLIVWKISDAKTNNKKEILSIIKSIEKKVKRFTKELK